MKASFIAGLFFLSAIIFQEGLALAKDKEIKLPPPITKGSMSVEEALQTRRSQRTFTQKNLSVAEIGQLAWAAQGVTEQRWVRQSLRTVPAAGDLYPLEVYIISKDGEFHYIPEGHLLEIMDNKDLRKELSAAALGQSAIKSAPVVIVLCAVYERVTAKYSARGVTYTQLETGHAAQNVLLQAVALGLAAIPMGAFIPDDVQKVLKIPGEQVPLYIIPVGYAD